MKLFCILLFFVSMAAISSEKNHESSCKIAVVGGGPAGVYLSYRLSSKHGDDICLFEKEDELGGRMKDEVYRETKTGKNVYVGLGARRVNKRNQNVIKLAKELGISLQVPEKRTQMIHHRGMRGYSSRDFENLYPKSKGPFDKDPNTSREDEIWQLVLKGEKLASNYPTVRDYVIGLTSKDDQVFVRAMTRFRADFDLDVAPSNYVEFMKLDVQLDPIDLYPVGGMTQFVKRMAKEAIAKGVRVYRSEPLLSFSEAKEKDGYRILTSKRTLHVKQLVLAIPPHGLNKIEGQLAAKIRQQPEYRSMMAIPVVVINQQWPTAWWKKIRNPRIKGEEAQTWRMWTTEHCISHVEIPQEAYLSGALLTRSVYTDDPKCVRMWKDLNQKGGLKAVAKEVLTGLRLVFGKSPTGEAVSIPAPLATNMQFWPAAWYYAKGGARASNKQIADWSLEPISGRKDLMLVGEAYWMNRPGWSEAAYFSADKLLEARFKVKVPDVRSD